jgi:hypothetical protein
VIAIVFLRVLLRHKRLTAPPVPGPRPVFVGPTQTEWQVRLPGGQHFVEWATQEPAAVEPIVVIDEPEETVLPSQRSLSLARLREPQVAKAKIRRQVRLIMTAEL